MAARLAPSPGGGLDRLRKEEGLTVDGISGTSAGAMNAAVLAAGWAAGGRETARQMLHAFWRKTSDAARSTFDIDAMLDDG